MPGQDPGFFGLRKAMVMLSAAFASGDDALQFCRVIQQGEALVHPGDLRRWLAGDVHTLLPHEVILVATGDTPCGALRIEVAATGPRGAERSDWRPLMHCLCDCWVAAQHAPCRVDLGSLRGPSVPPGVRCALVHGLRGPASGVQRIVAVLGAHAAFSDLQALVLRLLLPFIDMALRRLPAPRGIGGAQALSERERQIMGWVAMGKTNPEIGCILCISEFTVKNHLKSIFTKLDVSNRAQAVATLTRLTAHV